MHSSGKLIAHALNLKLKTVYNICRNYQNYKGKYLSLKYFLPENGRQKQKMEHFRPWQIERLMHPQTLQAHMSKSLNQRCKWIWDKWRVKVHRKYLSKLYREYGIRFLSSKYHFHMAVTRRQKLIEQQNFVLRHIDWLRSCREVLYLDETSCNCWVKK